MTSITPTELNLLRSRPHETNLWLSIYKPKVILTAQINDPTAAPGEMDIIYNGVTGSYTDIESGMTMYIGTTHGARDVGRIRVRSATSTTITVAVNSDIEWADDLYLMVVEFWEIDAVYQRMDVPDPADPTQQVWYKDYDIPYTNQNSALGSFICMGSHYAGFIDPLTGVCDVYYSASGTTTLRGNWWDFTCVWEFGDTGTGTTSTLNTPPVVSYDTCGHYTTKLTVTNTTTGAIDVSYRHISIYERPEVGSCNPILNWELMSLDGSRDAGGYQARIKIRENISDIVDGALIVLFTDDTYGGTKQSIGGNSYKRQSIFFVGYILDGSITYNYEDSSVEFNAGSPSEIMKITEGLVVALNCSTDPEAQDLIDDDIPSAWALLYYMNCKRAIYHYLRWQSTVLLTCDFTLIGSTEYIAFFDANRESLYDAINNLMKGTTYGEIVCDRQGKIWAEVSVAAIDNAAITLPTAMNIIKQDWIGTPAIEEISNYPTSYIEMGGIAFDPETPTDPGKPYSGSNIPYLAEAPGSWPAYRGNVKTFEGLAIVSQVDLNTLCGNVFAYLNAKYGHVELELSGDYRNIDIAPQEIINLSLEANDNPQRIVWNNKAFHPTGMSWSYDPQKGTLLPTLTLHEVTQGFPASTITIPPVPPVTDEGGGGFDVPPIYIPPIIWPPFPWPTGTAGVSCDEWVDAYASFDNAGTPYDKEEDGCYLQYGDILHACGYWRVPDGCTGDIHPTPVFLLQPGAYGGVLRGSTDIYIGSCGGSLTYNKYIQGAVLASPDLVDKVIRCFSGAATFSVTGGDIIKLVMRTYTIDDDPDPFTNDSWFLGWQLTYS